MPKPPKFSGGQGRSMTHDGRVHVKKLSPEEVNQMKDEVSTTGDQSLFAYVMFYWNLLVHVGVISLLLLCHFSRWYLLKFVLISML